MIKRISIRLIKDKGSAGMVEYAPLVALIGVLLIATLPRSSLWRVAER